MASTYTMVAYGSQGSAVKQLQSELNKRGYQLDEDGVFGKKTKAAVRDYQKKNRLTRRGAVCCPHRRRRSSRPPPLRRKRRPDRRPG